jgi:hypothetical protein
LTAPRIRFFLSFRKPSRYPSAVLRATVFKAAQSVCAAFALLIAGCSSGGVSITTSSPPDPTFLDGNWLLVGALPFVSPTQAGNKSFGIAMTFTVIGDQIAGGGSTQIPCSSSALLGGGVVVSGSAGPDGSFSVQTSSTQPAGVATLQIKGAVPSGSGSSWIGTYTFANTDASCPFASSGPITAVRIGDLTGTYSGSASLSPPPGSTGGSQPLSVSFTLQQGQATSGPSGSQSVDESILTGSLKVQGTACFASGQIVNSQSPVEGKILGTNIFATFTMDDGSHLFLTGNVEDTASSKLGVVNALVSGGKCDGQYVDSFEASRQ